MGLSALRFKKLYRVREISYFCGSAGNINIAQELECSLFATYLRRDGRGNSR
jgi:hypothetical protein